MFVLYSDLGYSLPKCYLHDLSYNVCSIQFHSKCSTVLLHTLFTTNFNGTDVRYKQSFKCELFCKNGTMCMRLAFE